MTGIQCTSCSLWFGSELGLKIHYSKMHAIVGECNRKRKVTWKTNNDNYLNNDMLFELCEAFGEAREEQDLMDDTLESRLESRPESRLESRLESRPESRRKRIFLDGNKINRNDQLSGLKCSDVQDDVLEDNINYSITNKEDKEDDVNDDVNEEILIPDDLDEKDVESDKGDIDEEQQIDDIFVDDNKDQQDETIFANAINMDKEEMNEDSLLKLLEEYELEKNQNGRISLELEAGIELLSLLWKSNASFQLYGKIVSWAEQFFLQMTTEKFPPRKQSLKC